MDELYRKIGVFNIQINRAQALEDLDILKYILLRQPLKTKFRATGLCYLGFFYNLSGEMLFWV